MTSMPVQLRANCVSFLESVGEAIGAMAPSGGIATIVPLSFATAGNGTWLLFPFVIVAYLLIARNMNVFASRTASPGALYAYTSEGWGPMAGIVGGWTYLAAVIFALAGTTVCVALYVGILSRLLTGTAWTPALVLLVTAAILALAWGAAFRDIRLSTKVMLGTEFISLGLILVLGLIFLFHTGRWIDPAQVKLSGVSANGMRLGMILAFMSLTGFEASTTLGGEARNPLKTIPRTLLTCLLPIGFLYLFNAYVLTACFHGNPVALDKADSPYDQLAVASGVPVFGLLISGGIALCFFTCILGQLNAGSRVLYEMSRRGAFFHYFGAAHPVNATPYRALALLALLTLTMTCVLLLDRSAIMDSVGYVSQISSLAYAFSYLGVCSAAPLFLRRRGALRMRDVAFSVVASLILGAILFASLYPLPPAPWDKLPYILAGVVAVGSGTSGLLLMRKKPTLLDAAI
jgi:amino acid transporter